VTLEQLRIFVMVAERAHMTRAAEALGLTQSAVSAAIAALEARHGVKLFDRVGRGLALSEAGRLFLGEATGVLLRARVAEQSLMDLAGLKRGTLTIAASQTLSGYWLPGRLAGFADAHPGVKLQMIAGNTADAAHAVLEGRAELGFVEGVVDDHALLRRPVGRDHIALYAAPGHRLSGAAAIQPSALADARWVLRGPGSGTRSHFEREITALGLAVGALQIVLEVPSNEAALTAAAEGGLIAAVSELAAAPFVATGLLARLALDLPPRRFELITHKERRPSAAGAAFVERLALRDR
jgi:DNA-binding transcriptional LysR family regulator